MLSYAIQTNNEKLAHKDDEKTRVAVTKAVTRVAYAWKLTNQEGADLFNVPIATWNRMKSGAYNGRLDQDKMTRASLIIGIYKGLRLLFNGPLTCDWVKIKNNGSGFGGHTPMQIMTEGGIPTMMAVRQHIDALRGGV
jgi:hypothetical protein